MYTQLPLYPHETRLRRLVRDLPHSKQPQNRLAAYGAGALRDGELLPLVIGTADARGWPRMRHLREEDLRVLILDTRNRVLSMPVIYRGSLETSIVRVAKIFPPAVSEQAAAIIVADNHPSGDPSPSPEDVHVTRQIVEAGGLFDIQVLDHLVIGDGRYVSLKERTLAFD